MFRVQSRYKAWQQHAFLADFESLYSFLQRTGKLWRAVDAVTENGEEVTDTKLPTCVSNYQTPLK